MKLCEKNIIYIMNMQIFFDDIDYDCDNILI